jgi:lipoyl(octanoyl) transferase
MGYGITSLRCYESVKAMYQVKSINQYVPYQDGLRMQMDSFNEVLEDKVNGVLYLLEHDPVFTIGTSGGGDNLLCTTDELDNIGIEVVNVDRGGNITYHGPGQLVVYPIFNLAKLNKDVHWYVESLEQVVINLLQTYGIEGSRKDAYRGVWVGDKKICATGVHVRKWITTHGISFNYAVNKEHFKLINPCGITEFGVASLNDYIENINSVDIRNRMIRSFESVFGIHFESLDEEKVCDE